MVITMDGIAYNLRIPADTWEESFTISEGPNGGKLLGGITVRDIDGTAYAHSFGVEPDPAHYDDFEAFYLAISAPVQSHTITMPHASQTITYDAMITGGKIIYGDTIGGKRIYKGLTVEFTPVRPQRVV